MPRHKTGSHPQPPEPTAAPPPTFPIRSATANRSTGPSARSRVCSVSTVTTGVATASSNMTTIRNDANRAVSPFAIANTPAATPRTPSGTNRAISPRSDHGDPLRHTVTSK